MELILNAKADWDEAQVGGVVAANETALGIMQRATKLPECDWGLEYSRGSEASIAYVARAHVLSRLNTLQGIREMAQGHSQAAVDTWVAGIRFAKDLSKGGTLVLALTAKNVLLLELHTLTAEARQGRLSNFQRKQLNAAVSALPEDGFSWRQAWETDQIGVDVLFNDMQRSQDPASVFERLMGQPAPKDCMPPSAQQLKVFHDYMDDVGSALRLPTQEASQRLAELQGRQKSICETIRMAIPSAKRVNDARAEIAATRKELLKSLQVR
jgi:hypothetical protein